METEPEVDPAVKEAYDKKFKFTEVRTNLQGIVDYWKTEIGNTDIRRQERNLDIGDIEELRESGEIKPDDTFIPERVINTNIRREQPSYINFLTQSQRLLVFNCLSNPELDTRKLEIDFTRGMTYKGWIKPHVRSVDGSQSHGWDSVEVTFDSTKPLNCGIEHISHDKLLFPKGTTDIQKCADLIRVYDVTPMQAKDFIKQYGFSKVVLDSILDKRTGKREHEHLKIYKRWCKFEGVVYVSWFMLDEGAADWLKEPEKLDLGIAEKGGEVGPDGEAWVATDIKQYPVFILPYLESEEDKIESLKGRCYLDGPKQEAKTAILSGYVNGLLRATNVYCSPKNDDGNGGAIKQLDITLQNGTLLNKPVEFYSTPYPDPAVLQGLQYIDVTNQQEAGNIAAAVTNRKDSRKTATELSIAKEETASVSSVPIALFSDHIRNVYSFAWLIVQSQALQGNVRLLLVPTEGAAGIEWVNNDEIIGQDFDCRAAGDVDVILRAQTIQNMMNDLPLMMQTGAKDEFIGDLVRLKYPEKGERYASLIQQGNQHLALINQLSTLIKQSITPEMLKAMPPEQQQMLQQLDAQVQQALAPPQLPTQQAA